jgi:hypothetical protein
LIDIVGQTKFGIAQAGSLFLIASLCLLLPSCKQEVKRVQAESTDNQQTQHHGPYRLAHVVGSIQNSAVKESSGLIASRSTPGAYWTHNDSGDGPFIYAMNAEGQSLGTWRVSGAEADDWEDISIGPGPEAGKSYLYIGDIGDNEVARKEITIYRVLEPKPDAALSGSSKKNPEMTEPAEAIRLRYPARKHDAETLLVHPQSAAVYIVTKEEMGNPTVYEAAAPLSAGEPITMKSLGELKIRSLFGGIITGGSISPDGKRVALCDYFQAYELSLPADSKNFNDIWKQRLVSFNFGKREQGESITYRLDGQAVLGTSEGKRAQVIEAVRN